MFFDYAKYFIKRGMDTNHNTYDGNMKLQKMLVFANMIHLANTGGPLFDDPIRAFANGCVIESVRLRYKNDYYALYEDSMKFEPQFEQDEYDALNTAIDIFGSLSAQELSELNHSFTFWKNAFKNSVGRDGYKDKNLSIVSLENMLAECNKVKSVVEAYRSTRGERCFSETVNGVKFYYDPSELSMTEDVLETLEDFSRKAEEDSYSIYLENGSMVIY
jgi:Uncharacterized phage-associated protein